MIVTTLKSTNNTKNNDADYIGKNLDLYIETHLFDNN